MRTFFIITIILVLSATLSFPADKKEPNFKARDAAWREAESDPRNQFRVDDRNFLKKDGEVSGWRKDDISWRSNDAKSDNEWRKRDKEWLKNDSR